MRVAPLKPSQPDHANEAAGRLFDLRRCKSFLTQAIFDVLLHVQPREQRIVLKYHAAIRSRPRNRSAIKKHCPAIGLFKARDDVKERRLAATART